ncbi:ATP-binding protein [Variovorax gossypii]|uniref:ATP-binding protein n=1 Tax=Variovorax gossypii TaxID=1679495 RepID=A0A431TGC8_9BURK|nr:ATP-binding protein [Variovorax gossypii]RTQ32271.1 ATP-binding protein [Variovorax gossypii]
MAPKKPKRPKSSTAAAPATAPAEGERRALRGYIGQYERAGAAIYAALERDELLWIGVADRNAGIADDLVLGFEGLVVGHQFKTSKFPGTFTVETLFTGANGLWKPLVHAWQCLRKDNPGSRVEIRLVVNDFPSTTDKPGDGTPPHSAAFLEEFQQHASRSLADWYTPEWSRLVDHLRREAGLSDGDFEQFLHSLRLVYGTAADFIQSHKLNAEQARQASEIASVLPKLVADARDKDRWTRDELLRELGWRDPAKTLLIHRFPVGAYVQRNRDTEVKLLAALQNTGQGYVSLIGPPGSGKSTLLQVALATESNIRLVRYLAYVPGAAQGVGRGEADNFLTDVGAQLRNSGLIGLRLRDDSLHERREQFGVLVRQAGERFDRDGIRTIIVVDGLDHVPREERPTNSLLGELPLPAAIPNGVVLVLGTQRLDLANLKPAVKEQAEKSDRLVLMSPLRREEVARMADALGLPADIPRLELNKLTLGHPLATRYLIQALLHADEAGRKQLLSGRMPFDGDIETVYTAAWREIASDSDAMDVLGFIARAEAPMDLRLLATVVKEPAIERALVVARHLLRSSPQGWSVFHNSFRLFVIAQPRTRLGRVDVEYSQRVYRDLAELAKNAPHESAQRWLELRYRARAGDAADVLALAMPARFRLQLADGRSIAEIHADIRLALLAVRGTHDATAFTRLLLCRDEVGRRETALEYANQLPLAMLAVGDIDSALSFVRYFPDRGYDVVDALLARGDFERAKELFESIEPLSQLHTSKFQNHGRDNNIKEFERWARRAVNFRDIEQIQTAIDHLAAEGLHQPEKLDPESVASLRQHLRREAAEATLLQKVGADPQELCSGLGVADEDKPSVMVHAGLVASRRGDVAQALALFDAAAALPGFGEVPNGDRRRMALIAFEAGRRDLAQALFDKLVAPMISMCDDETDLAGLGYLVGAAVHHARLCTLLNQPLPSATPSKHSFLHPIQQHASTIGVLLGRTAVDNATVPAGSIRAEARVALGYMLRLTPEAGSESYRIQQAFRAIPVLAQALLRLSAKCGEEEYRAVLREIDAAIASSTLGGTAYLRRRLAVDAYRVDADRAGAVDRLNALVTELQESTPSEQIDGLADLAMALAAVGDVDRAKQLLATIPEQCLGYALAPKKDPQYAIWRDILILANTTDPEGRVKRVSNLMRQVGGMAETEGSAAAHRLTMSLIEEAMQVGPRFGFEVSKTLADWHLISWPNRVDLLMTGMVRRSPDLVLPCATVWCGLCLPFYMEPHYRDPYHVGDFIDIAADGAGPGQIEPLTLMLLGAIEVASRAHERAGLLQRLRTAAKRHGFASAELEAAVARWMSEAPEPRHSSTPSKYDSEATLEELERAFEADGDELNYNAPYRFRDLAERAPLHLVRRMFERWQVLRDDARCRFLMVKRLAAAGEVEYAKKLIQGYETSKDPWSSWSQWMGGGKFLYFEAKKLLEGPSTSPAAFENIVDSVTAGQESTQSLLTDLDSILPLISATPAWPAIWSLLEEQMACTREFQLGRSLQPSELPLSDTELMEDLLHFAYRLPVAEVQRHARNCTLRLAGQAGHGQALFKSLMRRLLTGDSDAPLHALGTLLAVDSAGLAPELGTAVAALVSHRDISIAESAALLSHRWGLAVSMDAKPLPLFYSLELEALSEGDHALKDERTGAMRVESPLGWTQMLRSTAQHLAQAAGIDEMTIRRRAAMLIQDWGGLEAFGPSGVKRLEAQLRALDMQITYLKPHAYIAITALRHVAGELRLAGKLNGRDRPTLLERLGCPLPPRPLRLPQVRPEWIRMPLFDRHAGWSERGKKWVDEVDSDVAPFPAHHDGQVVAEVSRIKIFTPRQSEQRLYRFRAPAAQTDGEDFDQCYATLPIAVWLGQHVALDNELAPTLVRRVVCSVDMGFDAATYPFALCANWVKRLRWRAHDEEPSVFLDASGAAAAKLYWWRDAGPVDIDAESIWGEGCYLVLTPAGLEQLTAARGKVALAINVFASRQIKQPSSYGQSHLKTAKNGYLV